MEVPSRTSATSSADTPGPMESSRFGGVAAAAVGELPGVAVPAEVGVALGDVTGSIEGGLGEGATCGPVQATVTISAIARRTFLTLPHPARRVPDAILPRWNARTMPARSL